MFKLQKINNNNKATKSPGGGGERIEFKFSRFKAFQVPRGWDRLFVSVVSVETGKILAKSTKAVVHNGNCQWTDSLTESVWLPQDGSPRELHVKFVVAMGSARSGILGEAVLNVSSHMSSSTPTAVSLLLKKCNHGTTLQAKVQCLTPKKKLREPAFKETDSEEGSLKSDSPEMELKSQDSNTSLAKNDRSYSSTDLGHSTNPEQNPKKMTSSSSGSQHIYNSAEGSIRLSRSSNLSGDQGKNQNGGPNSASFQNSVAPGSYHSDHSSQSDHSFNSRITNSVDLSEDEMHSSLAPTSRNSGTSRSMFEAAEDTIHDLREESKKWERDARKLIVELDMLRKEFAEQSKTRASLDIELSAASAERDGLQKQVQQLKVLLEKSKSRPSSFQDSTIQDIGLSHLVKELGSEISFHKETNTNLSLQLHRSQESNVELVSVLKELEETLEHQKHEIVNLSGQKFSDIENFIQAANTEKNNLMLQVQALQESESLLQEKVHELEQALEEKGQNTSLNKQRLPEEIEKGSLRARVSDSMKGKHYSAEMEASCISNDDLNLEIDELKLKLQELENDCQELTEENFELLLKLKETKNSTGGLEAGDNDFQMQQFEEEIRTNLQKEIEDGFNHALQDLESIKLDLEVKVKELSEELGRKRFDILRLEAGSQAKEQEIGSLEKRQRELEDRVADLVKEKSQVEKDMENVMREGDIASKCLNDLLKDLKVLTSSINSHVSANKSLQRRNSEAENRKHELELQLMAINQEKEELSTSVSYLEAQVRSLMEKREAARLELEKSKSDAATLQEEIENLKREMELRQVEWTQKLQEVQSQWLEADKDHEHLRIENAELQSASERLKEECSFLRREKSESDAKKLELHEHCTWLEEKLSESQQDFPECSKKVEILEEKLSGIMKENACKERGLTSQLDHLVKEKEDMQTRLDFLNQKYLEAMDELQNLQQEAGSLAEQLQSVRESRDRVASDAAREVTSLRAGAAKLETELNTAQIESEVKILGLTDELVNSRRNQQLLKDESEQISKLLANYRSCEERLKSTLNDLELKITVSEYERQQLAEECANLKAQLLIVEPLQEEVTSLRNELKTIKSEKLVIAEALDQISKEFNELKTERSSCVEEIASLQNAVSELENSKLKRDALEGKLQQLENELMEKEVLSEQLKEIKAELGMIKRTNRQQQKQTLQLEKEKEKCSSRAQSLEEELILTKEELQNVVLHSREFEYGHNGNDQNHQEIASKIRSLEDELAKAIEANNLLKVQTKRLMSEGRRSRTGSPRKMAPESEHVPKERLERSRSSVETELKELRERYLHMSLRYAEVEAEREELVMKLKSASTKRAG